MHVQYVDGIFLMVLIDRHAKMFYLSYKLNGFSQITQQRRCSRHIHEHGAGSKSIFTILLDGVASFYALIVSFYSFIYLYMSLYRYAVANNHFNPKPNMHIDQICFDK